MNESYWWILFLLETTASVLIITAHARITLASALTASLFSLVAGLSLAMALMIHKAAVRKSRGK